MISHMHLHTHFYSGISGLQLPIPRYLYPPPYENASRLTYYATFFKSIEINSSFYKIPQAATVAKWVGHVPENFRFTFKLWGEITHSKNLAFKETDVAAFFNAINPVQDKKGCVLVQFPPSLDVYSIFQLNELLACIKKTAGSQGWKIAVEFRNKSWYQQNVYELLDLYNVSVVIHDIPKSATPSLNQKADFIYLRFHGPSGNYRGSYPEYFLNEYATYIHEWIEEGKTVYAYFNNTMGDAFINLKSLNEFLEVQQLLQNDLINLSYGTD